MLALFQNEFVLYALIVAIVATLLIARFIGLKTAATWVLGKNSPETRQANAKATKASE